MDRKKALLEFTAVLPCGVVWLDAASRVQSINPVAEDLLGLPSAQLVGKPIHAVLRLFEADSAKPVPINCAAPRNGSEPMDGPFLLVTPAGKERHVSVRCSALPSDSESVIITLVDHTTAAAMSSRAAHYLRVDPITGLANRLQFQSSLLRLLEREQRNRWLILVRFSSRAFLLQPADSMLKQLARLTDQLFAGNEVAARVGDETIGILHCGTKDLVRSLSNAIVDTASSFRFEWSDVTFEVAADVAVLPITGHVNDPWFLAAAGRVFLLARPRGQVRFVTEAELEEAYRSAVTPQNR